MMRSLFSGISGLRVHQTKMDVIGHNISNVNTIGYKASRVTFNEVFSQTAAGASPANAESGRGGTNPMQIGLGVNIASIDKIMTQGAAQRTDNPFDLMIQGEGFFIVGDVSGQYFTRAGALNIDASGNLVTTNGMTVMGWNQIGEDGRPIPGVVQPITIGPDKEYVEPSATTQINFSGNLNALQNTTRPKVMPMTFFDSVGNKYIVDVEMRYYKAGDEIPDPTNLPDGVIKIEQDGWVTSIRPQAFPNGDRSKGMDLAFGEDGSLEFTGEPATADKAPLIIGQMIFDEYGKPVEFDTDIAEKAGMKTDGNAIVGDGFQFAIRIAVGDDANPLMPNAVFGGDVSLSGDNVLANAVKLDFSKLVQFGTQGSDAISQTANGNAPGTLNGISIGTDGSLIGRYSNGQVKVLAKIPVANFKNPAGLEKVGENLYVPTGNSGEFDGVGSDITEKGGSILGGVLEMSNVDLSSEFVEMITTQRGFQANSRIISTSDEMLQELVNLKR